jgi:hypothetical protein
MSYKYKLIRTKKSTFTVKNLKGSVVRRHGAATIAGCGTHDIDFYLEMS